MKKFLSLLLALTMIFSLCACGSNSSNNETNMETNTSETSQPTKPTREALEQVVVNRCCQHSNVKRISITYGTFDTYWDEEENVWVTDVKGTYYPVDEFGEYDDKMQFGVRLHGLSVEEITDSFREAY